jgi:hypothetical protein
MRALEELERRRVAKLTINADERHTGGGGGGGGEGGGAGARAHLSREALLREMQETLAEGVRVVHEAEQQAAAAVSRCCLACNGSPCLRYCAHGASIGGGHRRPSRCQAVGIVGGGGGGGGRAAAAGAVPLPRPLQGPRPPQRRWAADGRARARVGAHAELFIIGAAHCVTGIYGCGGRQRGMDHHQNCLRFTLHFHVFPVPLSPPAPVVRDTAPAGWSCTPCRRCPRLGSKGRWRARVPITADAAGCTLSARHRASACLASTPCAAGCAALWLADLASRVRVERIGSHKCGIVGKYQSDLVMINPIIFTGVRHRPEPPGRGTAVSRCFLACNGSPCLRRYCGHGAPTVRSCSRSEGGRAGRLARAPAGTAGEARWALRPATWRRAVRAHCGRWASTRRRRRRPTASAAPWRLAAAAAPEPGGETLMSL